jgi:hypothetical protein
VLQIVQVFRRASLALRPLELLEAEDPHRHAPAGDDDVLADSLLPRLGERDRDQVDPVRAGFCRSASRTSGQLLPKARSLRAAAIASRSSGVMRHCCSRSWRAASANDVALQLELQPMRAAGAMAVPPGAVCRT